MQRISSIAKHLFGTLPGLLIVVVAWDALIVASLSLFSGPVRCLGLAELLGVDLGDTQRVGRIIMLYHSLAIPVVAALVYLVLDQVPMSAPEEAGKVRRSIVVPITAGYMVTSLGGMTFAYGGGRSWIAHGLYVASLSLVFYAGVLLAIALWPSRRWTTGLGKPQRPGAGRGGTYAHLGDVPLERLAFFINAYMFRQPGQEKAWTVPFFDTGIALSLLALAILVASNLSSTVRRGT